jgi:DNA helicase IV
LTSPRFAKGLEAESVVLCALPETYDTAGLAALYVAVTRARVSLDIVVTKADRRRLQDLIRQRLVTK